MRPLHTHDHCVTPVLEEKQVGAVYLYFKYSVLIYAQVTKERR